MKTFNDQWKEYMKMVLPQEISPGMFKAIKCAFFAGGGGILDCVRERMTVAKDEDEFSGNIKFLVEELQRYSDHVSDKGGA